MPDAVRLLAEAEPDILTYKTFPRAQWRRIHSTRTFVRTRLEWIHREVRRRTNVVGIFPDQPSVIRLVGSILKEKDDDWRASSRRYFSENSIRLVTDPDLANGDEPSPFLEELTTTITAEA